jgi:hypothetical protein
MKESCSPLNSMPKGKPLSAPPAKSRGVEHSAIYGDRAVRSDATRAAPLRGKIHLDMRRP